MITGSIDLAPEEAASPILGYEAQPYITANHRISSEWSAVVFDIKDLESGRPYSWDSLICSDLEDQDVVHFDLSRLECDCPDHLLPQNPDCQQRMWTTSMAHGLFKSGKVFHLMNPLRHGGTYCYERANICEIGCTATSKLSLLAIVLQRVGPRPIGHFQERAELQPNGRSLVLCATKIIFCDDRRRL